MASVQLIDIDSSVREQCLNLRLRPDQMAFVPDVASSLVLATRYPKARPMAVVVGEKVVGFSMHGIDEASGSWKIYRLIIDADSQGMGFGRATLRELVRLLEAEAGATTILVSYNEENEPARRLYRSEGFEEVSVVDGKVTARRRSTTQ